MSLGSPAAASRVLSQRTMLEEASPRDDGKSGPGAPWRSYKERLAGLAQRLVDAQRPIRILNAVKWEKLFNVALAG